MVASHESRFDLTTAASTPEAIEDATSITIRNDYEDKEPIYTKLADGDIYLLAREYDTFTYLVNQSGELVMKIMEKK